MVNAICSELALQKEFCYGEVIETIYFGGGSPSLLTSKEIDTIINTILNNYTISPTAEVTLEGNPDDLGLEYLKDLYSLGINRLSIGIQSFDDSNLRFMNRVHTSAQSTNCLEDAAKAGFSNYSLDLIYGITSIDHSKWNADIAQALIFNPKHISAYCLTIEEKTVFGNWLKKGKLSQIDDNFASEQYEFLMLTLKEHGYEHYEISNFALPGFYSKHNSSYWNQKMYLGVGPGAHSFNRKTRRYNIENNNKYIEYLNNNKIPYTEEILTLENIINEYIITTLRTQWGTDIAYLKKNYVFDLSVVKNKNLELMLNEGLLMIENNFLKLTQKGKLLADKVAEELMI